MTDGPAWLPATPLSARFPLYSRANADEVLPGFVSPLGVTLSWEGGLLEGWRLGNHALGGLTDAELADPTTTCGAFRRGFFYVNVSVVRVFGLRSGAGLEAVDAAFFSGHAGIPPHAAHPDDLDPVAMARAAEHLAWATQVEHWPELDALKARAGVARARRPDLSSLAAMELVARARSLRPALQEAFRLHAIATTDAAVGPGMLAVALPDIDPSLRIQLVGGIDDVDSERLLRDLWVIGREVHACDPLSDLFDRGPELVAERLARPDLSGPLVDVRNRLDGFLVDHGARGTDEWDLAAPVWEVDPTPVLAIIDRLRARPDADEPEHRRSDAARRREAALAEARRLVGRNAERVGMLELAQAMSLRFFSWRERAKTASVRLLHEQRMAVRELGRRAAAQGAVERDDDVFWLLEAELDDFADRPASFGSELARRREESARLAATEPPPLLLVGGDVRDASGPEAPDGVARQGDVLVGAPGSAGLVTGRARVVHGPGEAHLLGRGDILVAARTDASWTPLFLLASGVVAGAGAFASHAVIVGRELGLPCVVGLEGAASRIPDGAMVEVDGSRGTVRLL